MSERDGYYKKLILRILKNPLLDKRDRPDVKKVIDALDLEGRGDLEDVNDKIKDQQRIEAIMVYLMGEYGDLLDEMEETYYMTAGGVAMTQPEKDEETHRMLTKDDRILLADANEDVQEAKKRRNWAKSLHRDLKNLEKTVYGRNDKLGNLSVNYRRQMAVDSNAD